jgi:hypothetical protein
LYQKEGEDMEEEMKKKLLEKASYMVPVLNDDLAFDAASVL